MTSDIAALNLTPGSDAEIELARLTAIVSFAAQLGGLLRIGPTTAAPRFPTIHVFLSVFGRLFVQGASEAATGRIDALRTTVTRADALLALAVEAETRVRPTP